MNNMTREVGRYRFATFYAGPRFGRMNFPVIDMTGAVVYVLSTADAGRLYNVAYGFYKDERLWWIIALANSIRNPFDETELAAGRMILIPTLQAVNAALQSGV